MGPKPSPPSSQHPQQNSIPSHGESLAARTIARYKPDPFPIQRVDHKKNTARSLPHSHCVSPASLSHQSLFFASRLSGIVPRRKTRS